jgi:hypothetical protein
MRRYLQLELHQFSGNEYFLIDSSSDIKRIGEKNSEVFSLNRDHFDEEPVDYILPNFGLQFPSVINVYSPKHYSIQYDAHNILINDKLGGFKAAYKYSENLYINLIMIILADVSPESLPFTYDIEGNPNIYSGRFYEYDHSTEYCYIQLFQYGFSNIVWGKFSLSTLNNATPGILIDLKGETSFKINNYIKMHYKCSPYKISQEDYDDIPWCALNEHLNNPKYNTNIFLP